MSIAALRDDPRDRGVLIVDARAARRRSIWMRWPEGSVAVSCFSAAQSSDANTVGINTALPQGRFGMDTLIDMSTGGHQSECRDLGRPMAFMKAGDSPSKAPRTCWA
ncbi:MULTISPECIES: hypothetical protein [Bradyrhizobium]|uniref:hypothetical protein n=1 Tax=Bradyrhizobium TaxID=374 RepID=UPI001009007D|nr:MULTISPECIES: hypothetical protein [Bradyrhizobium]MDN4984446.1 hypothetical protein [Bradyrhizobium sp. WYCCWR 13022]MDT4736868.1 hypothetical protein [Bradyrhizobium sp. WYCCWR 12699]